MRDSIGPIAEAAGQNQKANAPPLAGKVVFHTA
jgi:hypothetical protein